MQQQKQKIKLQEKQEKVFWYYCGVTHTDTTKEADYLAQKLCKLRIFTDENDKMNLSLKEVEGELLIVSQFTLYGNCLDGNRPSFTDAAKPEVAKKLYDYFCLKCEENGVHVEKGIFGSHMKVNLLNDGPVTIIIEK